jgi:flagellar biosynthesis/type III secretory pathway chaperone
MSTIEGIKNILMKQITASGMLLEVLQKERECLIELDVTELDNLSKEKDTIVLWLRLLEEEKNRLMNKFAIDSSIDGDINLDRLCGLTGDHALQMFRLQTVSILQSIAELNEFNRILMERSMSFFKNAAGFLDSFGLCMNQGATSTVSKEA